MDAVPFTMLHYPCNAEIGIKLFCQYTSEESVEELYLKEKCISKAKRQPSFNVLNT